MKGIIACSVVLLFATFAFAELPGGVVKSPPEKQLIESKLNVSEKANESNSFSEKLSSGIILDDFTYPGDISGTVTSSGPSAIEGVVVYVEGTNLTDTTNAAGEYLLEGIAPGQVDISFIKPGFRDTTVVDFDIIPQQVATLNMTLYDDSSAEIIIWYGNLDQSTIEASLDQTLDVNVYMQTQEHVEAISFAVVLGVDRFYVDTVLSQSLGEYYYPFNEWDDVSFEPMRYEPNPDGWSSQTFLAFGRIIDITDPPFNSLVPVLALKFVVKLTDNPEVYGRTVHCLGRGIDPYQGVTNSSDLTGGIMYSITEHFSPLHFGAREMYGRVTNQNGQPLEDVLVQPVGDPHYAYTNDNGDYTLYDLAPVFYDVSFSHPAVRDSIAEHIRVFSYTNTQLNMVLQELGNLGGVVTNPDMAPIGNVLVTLQGTSHNQYTNPQGEYFFGDIDAQNYTVTFSHTNYYDQTRSVSVTGGDTASLDVTMPYLGAIEGLVENIAEVPIQDVHVVINPGGSSANSNQYGEFSFYNIDPVTYSLTLTHPDYAQRTQTGIVVPSGETTGVEISMQLLGIIEGTVTRSDGISPLGGVEVTLLQSGNPVDAFTTNPDGQFHFDHLLSGSYSLRAEKDDYVTQTVTNVQSVYDQVTTRNISLILDFGTLAGNITGNSSPLDSVSVTVLPDHYHDFSEPSGDYEITMIPSGSYTAKFYKPGYQDGYEMSVNIMPEQTTILNYTMSTKDYDLALNMFTNPFYRANGDAFYQCKITNLGALTAQDVELTLELPDDATYVSSDPAGVYDAGVVTWAIGDVLAGEVHSFNVDITIAGTVVAGQYLIANGEVSLSNTDHDYTNNHASISSPVLDSWSEFDKYASPPGVGARHFIPGESVLNYSVFFENAAGMPGSVTDILVTDTLDIDLDWDTFVFGATSHETVYSAILDYATGVVTWTFTGVNLPPNSIPPDGEGYVTYTADLGSAIENEAEITNQAAVQFDSSPWVRCPAAAPLLRTIDSRVPSSQIAGLPPIVMGDNQVTLNWSENDYGGSGIAAVEIYVSENSGPYALWYTAVPGEGETIFTGEYDSCYSFYSIAVDQVDNTEAAPGSEDASVCFQFGYAYTPGDANMINGMWPAMAIGSDVTYIVNYFRGNLPPCLLGGFFAAADVNGDCVVQGSDVTKLVNYFRGTTPMSFCPDYPPTWPLPDDVPELKPDGWPECEATVLISKTLPSEAQIK